MGFLDLWPSKHRGLWRLKQHYQEVEKGELTDKQIEFLSDSGSAFLQQESHTQKTRRNLRIVTLLNLLVLGISVFINCFRYLPKAPLSTNSAVREVSYYSPIFNDLDIDFEDIQLNGTLWPPKEPSWMRAEPSPETDAMWQVYEPANIFPITRADVIGLGKDPKTAVKFDNEYWGLGDDMYMAMFDMLHKTHCLNLLRQMTFEDYGEQTPLKKKRHNRLWWVHVRHCVDMLMQDQLCHADADIITFQWVDTQKQPFPDMSINRKCRSSDQILEWGKRRFVENEEEKLKGFKKPEDAHQVPFDRGYYEWYGFEGSDLFPNGTGYEW